MKPDGSLDFNFIQIPRPSGPFVLNFLKYSELVGITKISDTHPHTGGSMDTLSNPG